MAKAKRIGTFLLGVLLGTGLCQIGAQGSSAGSERFIWRAEVQPYGKAEELRSQVEQPMTVLFVAPSGQSVRKGDLLVELDASALTGARIQQVLDTRKAVVEMSLAEESLQREERTAAGQVTLAEKALRLAQNQLKAYTEGEYPHQLALAEGTAAIAKQKELMLRDRMEHLRADAKASNDPATANALQDADLALREAMMRTMEAQNSLALLKSCIHDNKVAEIELIVAQKEFDLVCAKDSLSAATSRGALEHSLAEMRCQMERDRLAKLDDQIGKCKIYAPRDGTVLQPEGDDETPIKAGVTVNERQVLIRLLPVKP